MFTKRCSPMHYISICTKQMSLQALYGIVAALTQLFSALNISSCSHLACYVDINKNPQLLKETREQQGEGEIIVVQARQLEGLQLCIVRSVSPPSGSVRYQTAAEPLLSTTCTAAVWPLADRFTKICMNTFCKLWVDQDQVLRAEFCAGLEFSVNRKKLSENLQNNKVNIMLFVTEQKKKLLKN